MNAQGDVESRLQRLKLESAVIDQHNKRLEKASNKQAADAVVDSEVSDVIKLNQSG